MHTDRSHHQPPAEAKSSATAAAGASDEVLMMSVARGDHAAFALLVDRHLGRMVALATRVTGSAAEAEDVAQDAFSRVWVHAARWQPDGAKFSTWLYRVTMNLAIDRTRRRQTLPLETAPEPVDPDRGGAGAVHDRQVSQAVRSVIDTLPETQRQALLLCWHEGLSNADAAAVMGVTVKAIESLLVRARRRLRDGLQDLYHEVVSS